MGRLTYPRYDDRCGWNALLPKRMPRPSAQGEHRVKYAIIGGGYTGLAAARRLHALDPNAEIAVLEATEIGEGSSARNSGFASQHDLKLDLSGAQLVHADTLNACLREGFDALTDAMEQGGFTCEMQHTGRITAAATPLGVEKVEGMASRAKALGVQHRLLDRAAIRRATGMDYYQCGIAIDEGHLLQPAALIRGLADTLPSAIALYENSPVRRFEAGPPALIETDQARFRADHVIFATNAAIKNFGYWRDRLVTIFTFAGLTEELDSQDAAYLGDPAWGVLPSHRLGTTLRRAGANRLLVRSLYAYEKPLDPQHVHDALTSCFHRRYPMLSHRKLEHVWSGTTALTMNGAPRWGKVAEGVYGAAGCNGSGIVKGTLLGQRLANLIVTGQPQVDVENVYGQANWIAPEPFRTIGFHAISAMERRKAGLEM